MLKLLQYNAYGLHCVLQLSGSFQIVIVYCLLPLTDILHPYSREIINYKIT